MLIKDRLKEYIIYINCQEKYLKLYDTIRAIRWIQIKKTQWKQNKTKTTMKYYRFPQERFTPTTKKQKLIMPSLESTLIIDIVLPCVRV